MRCHICDNLLETVVIDKRDGKIAPCPGCLEAVAVAEYERALEDLEQEDVLIGVPSSDGDLQPVEEAGQTGLGTGVGVSKH